MVDMRGSLTSLSGRHRKTALKCPRELAAVGKAQPQCDIGDRSPCSLRPKGNFAIGGIKALVANDLGDAAVGSEYSVQVRSRDLMALHQQSGAEFSLIKIGLDKLKKLLTQHLHH